MEKRAKDTKGIFKLRETDNPMVKIERQQKEKQSRKLKTKQHENHQKNWGVS